MKNSKKDMREELDWPTVREQIKRKHRRERQLREVEQGKLFDTPVVDPKKIKALSKKLYDGVKPVDKLTAGYDNKNDAKALKMVAALEKQADRMLKLEHVAWNGEPWLVTSVEYSINSGDWWVYAERSLPSFDTENFPIVDLY